MNLADLFIAKKLAGGGGGGTGTDNYNDLSNKPQINSTSLTGDKSAADLGLQSEINGDNKISADYVDDSTATNKFVTSSEKLTWGGKQDKIDADHKLSSDLVDDTNKTNKFVTSTEKSTWNGKQNAIDSSHKLSSDLVDDTNHTNKFVTSSEKETWNGKQDALTFDNTPTSGSNNPVKSGGIYTELAGKVNTSDIIPSSQGIPASPTDITVPSMKLVADTYVPNSSLVEVVNNGAKNVLPVLFNSTSINTVSVVNNGDGSITLNGTKPSSNPAIVVQNIQSTISTLFDDKSNIFKPNTDYTIKGTGDNRIRFQVMLWNTSEDYETKTSSDDLDFNSGTWTYATVRVWIAGSASFSNEKFYPMICTKSQFGISPEYEPYALGNQVLTPELIELVDSGAKNKLKNSAVTTTVGEAVFTVNGDGSISVYTTAALTESRSLTLISATDGVTVDANDIISGTPKLTTHKIKLNWGIGSSGNTKTLWDDDPDGYTTIGYSGSVRYLSIGLEVGTSISSSSPIKFYPMICSPAAWNVSKKYVPYRPNWDLVSTAVNSVDTLMKGIVLLEWSSTDGANATITHTVKARNDFDTGSSYNSGTYLLVCVNWATSGKSYIGVITFSGGQVANLTKVDIVTGFTPTISLTNGVISVSDCARISLYAIR